ENALSRAICEMLVACISPSLANIEAARPNLEMVLLQRARRFIEVHLGSSALSVDAICSSVGVSRRTLYRLFHGEGGVQHYNQARRLEQIKTLLSDPEEPRRISEVASEFGFARGDHFARAFRNRYGQSARDVREEVRFEPAAQERRTSGRLKTADGFDDWLRD